MSLANQISTWTMPRTFRAVKKDIHDEMQFHIESRIEELLEEGMSKAEAQDTATAEFGDRKAYQQDCQKIGLGLQPWFNVSAAIGLVASLATIAWLAMTLNDMRMENECLTQQLASQTPSSALASTPPAVAPAKSVQDYDEELKGKITDSEGNPVEGAAVLLVHKSWPGGRYTQEVYETETDEEGKYSFEDQYSPDMQNAFLVSILAEGHGFESRYTVYKAKKKAKDFNFKLKKATEIEFTFEDGDGEALADTPVFISGRKLGRKEHMIYFQSAESATWDTDEEGKVKLPFFTKGDRVTVNLMIDGDWQEVTFKVGKETSQTVPAKKK